MAHKFVTGPFWMPVARSLFLIATGAYLLAWYLEVRGPRTAALRSTLDGIDLIWWMLLVAWMAVSARRKKSIEDPGPAYSGTYVVIACGLAAAVSLAHGAIWPQGYIVPAVILLATLAAAALVYRFASKHASEIGEARFNTGGRAV